MFSKDIMNEIMISKGWSAYRLAKESGLATSIVNEILNGKKKSPSIDTICKIASALGVTVDSLLTESTMRDDLKSILPKLDKLSDEDKRMIIDIINRLNTKR